MKERVRNILQIATTLQGSKGGDVATVLKKVYDRESKRLMEVCRNIDTKEAPEDIDELQGFFSVKLHAESENRSAKSDYIYHSTMYHAVHAAWDAIFDLYERDRENADSTEEQDEIKAVYNSTITPLIPLKDALKEAIEQSSCDLIEF